MDCGRHEEWWEKKRLMGNVQHGGRRNGLWEVWGIVGDAGDCGRAEV